MDAARHHQPDHRQRLAAWLGLLATLLLYLAPLASQALARHHNLHGGHQGHSPAPTQPTAPYHGAHQGHHPAPTQPAAPHHGGHGMAHELCGYCTLLGQLPWLGPERHAAVAAAHPGRAQPPLPPPAILPALPHPPFQARAPPG